MISLLAILKSDGFRLESSAGEPLPAKIVRHKDENYDIELLRSDGWFGLYQSYQTSAVFDGCKQIVVFVGEAGLRSRFVGIYDVVEHLTKGSIPPVPVDCPHQDWNDAAHYYTLAKRIGFEDLEDRIVIDWTKDPINWYKPFIDRPIVEIRAPGRSLPPFRDYLHVHLSYDDLRSLMAAPDAHRDWKSGLSAVGGIYLIVDSKSGKQYVGSATGKGGIWQRWQQYVTTGHCDNAQLKELCNQSTEWPRAFRFSILQTFSRSLTNREAVAAETFFKQKLGSRANGLNAN